MPTLLARRRPLVHFLGVARPAVPAHNFAAAFAPPPHAAWAGRGSRGFAAAAGGGGMGGPDGDVPDYYAVLGLARDATPEQIKAAFRELGEASSHAGHRGANTRDAR